MGGGVRLEMCEDDPTEKASTTSSLNKRQPINFPRTLWRRLQPLRQGAGGVRRAPVESIPP
jgi:hypothetical protein